MGRFILRFQGPGDAPAVDLDAVRAVTAIKVLDASPCMLLVEATQPAVDTLMKALPGWSSTPERYIPLPNPRKQIRNP